MGLFDNLFKKNYTIEDVKRMSESNDIVGLCKVLNKSKDESIKLACLNAIMVFDVDLPGRTYRNAFKLLKSFDAQGSTFEKIHSDALTTIRIRVLNTFEGASKEEMLSLLGKPDKEMTGREVVRKTGVSMMASGANNDFLDYTYYFYGSKMIGVKGDKVMEVATYYVDLGY